MPPRTNPGPYRIPTDVERAFLRIVTRGHHALQQQIENCEIAEYDVTGWCDINVLGGPAASIDMVDGPNIDLTEALHVAATFAPPTVTQFTLTGHQLDSPSQLTMHGPPSYVGTILWMNEFGYLYSIEIVAYGGGSIVDPYALFVDIHASTPSLLRYRKI